MHNPLPPREAAMSTLEGCLLHSVNTNGTNSAPGAGGSFDKVGNCGMQTDYQAKFSVLNQGLPDLFKVTLQSTPDFVIIE